MITHFKTVSRAREYGGFKITLTDDSFMKDGVKVNAVQYSINEIVDYGANYKPENKVNSGLSYCNGYATDEEEAEARALTIIDAINHWCRKDLK